MIEAGIVPASVLGDVDVAGHSLRVQVSAGAVLQRVQDTDVDEMIVKADLALRVLGKDQDPPGFLIGSSWMILILLTLLFGYDVNYAAFSSDNPYVQEKVQPLTEKLSKLCVDSGLRKLRQDVEGKVYPVYDDSPIWVEIEEPED